MSLSNYIKKNCISYSNTENYHSRTLVAVSCSCRAKRNRRIRKFKTNKNNFANVKKQKYHLGEKSFELIKQHSKRKIESHSTEKTKS